MGKKKCPECPTCLPGWLAAFGDLMSLLLVFFVLLLSMSTMDRKKVSEAIGSLSGAMSVLEGGRQTEVSPERILRATPIEEQPETTPEVNRVESVIAEINEIIQSQGGSQVTLEKAEDGFVIRLPASLLFRAGSAQIQSDDAILFLKRIALMITKMPPEIQIMVHGHTDNSKLPTSSLYKDNWELSSARAVNVVKELIRNGIDPGKLGAAGHAEFDPIASNTTPDGRMKNRRVDIKFLSNNSQKPKNNKSVLEK